MATDVAVFTFLMDFKGLHQHDFAPYLDEMTEEKVRLILNINIRLPDENELRQLMPIMD